jgi:hypothetical protein
MTHVVTCRIFDRSGVTRLRVVSLSLALVFLCGSLAAAQEQNATMPRPATVDEAAKVLDLRDLPLLDGAEVPGTRRMAALFYTGKADVKKAYAFHRDVLVAKGWKELPGTYLAAETASGTLGKYGFVTAVSVFPGDSSKPGTVNVSINQLGNVDLAKLPTPPNAKLVYAGPSVAMYTTEAARDDTAKACRELLVARGWRPYGKAGNSLIFKQNAVRLNAMICVAPAQGGKTSIQYSAELLSADLPAPPDAARAHYADTTTALEFDAKDAPSALAGFYREILGKAGWKPTTEKTIKSGPEEVLIFRNPIHDMLTLTFAPIDNVLRGTLKHQSATEIAELERLARESAARKKAAPHRKPEPRPTVTIALPTEARDVKEKNGKLEFTVPAGKAKAVVEAVRQSLRQAGWKEDIAALEQLAGAVSLSGKEHGSLTINYTDTGLEPAKIDVTAIGVQIQSGKAEADQ